jgi:hypothetical protein
VTSRPGLKNTIVPQSKMPKQIVQASEVPSDSESEEEMVDVAPKTQKKALSEAKLKALELARVKAAQKAKQRSAVTKAAKEAERAKKMADKVNAFALQQKAKAIEAGLIHESPQAVAPPTTNGSKVERNAYDEIKSELKILRDLLLVRTPTPTRVESGTKASMTKLGKQQPVQAVPVHVPSNMETLKALLRR